MIAQTAGFPRERVRSFEQRERGDVSRRVATLLERAVEYVPNPLFAAGGAARRVEQLRPVGEERIADEGWDGRALYGAPLLSAAEERYLFCRMNFEKHRAEALRKKLRRSPENRVLLERIEEHLATAVDLRNRIVAANVRLVAAVARSFREPGLRIEDLVSAGQLPLIRAVELFDFSRGLCFSTYASNAVRNHFLRLRGQRARRRQVQIPGDPELLNEAPDLRAPPSVPGREQSQRRLLERLLGDLSPRERAILTSRFGLAEEDEGRTFQEIADELGLSKERVRVIAHRAVEQLQARVREEGLELEE